MQQLFISLQMDLSTAAPVGAGWYLGVFTEGQSMVPPTPISSEAAIDLAAAFQRALTTTEGEIPPVSVSDLALSADGLIRTALERQLVYCEEQAKKIASLRRKLGALQPTQLVPVTKSDFTPPHDNVRQIEPQGQEDNV